MATTTNFGWTTPNDTDLVKDGAAAIRTLGSSIDTTLVDLKGGTTGQVLAKASNTDMDFTFVNGGDITEVQAGVGISVASGTGPIPVITNSSTDLITTAGDLLYGTAADTVARLGIGTAGQVLKVNSGATAPEWGSAGGGLTLLDTGTLSGSSVTSASLSQSFINLTIIVRDWLPATDNARLRIRPNGVSAANSYTQGNNPGAATLSFDESYIGVSIDADNSVTENLTTITIPDYANTTTYKIVQSSTATVNGTTPANVSMYNFISAVTKATSAITTMNFHLSTGNFTSGNYFIYGS